METEYCQLLLFYLKIKLDNHSKPLYHIDVNKKEITIGRGGSTHCYQSFSTIQRLQKKPPAREALDVYGD